MTKDKAIELFEKCLQSISNHTEMANIEITRYCGNWSVTLRVWPQENNDPVKHQVIASCTSLVGKLNRDEDLGWFRGNKDDLSVDVVVNKPCKIVGYKTERKPVTKTIETGDFIDVKIPVTDCDIRKGKAQVGSFEPIMEEALS